MVKRYDPIVFFCGNGDYDARMENSRGGDYVEYSDYEIVEQELEKLKRMISDLYSEI